MKKISFLVLYVLLSGCSSDLVAKRYRPDFQTTITNSNKSVLILEPSVVAYKLADAKKENHEATNHLRVAVREAAIVALGKKGYKAVIISGDDETSSMKAFLKNKIERKTDFYVQKNHLNIGLVSEQEAMKLDDNFGNEAIELGQIFNTDLILGLQYKSVFLHDNSPGKFNGLLFQAVDAVAKTGLSKKEVYSCFVVLIDVKTGNVIYSNGLYQERTGWIYVSEKDLFNTNYKDQIATLIEIALPNP